jgi:hypothetical protein
MLVLARKKYVCQVVDNEGESYVNKPWIKNTGIEAISTSTPKFCRDKIIELQQDIFDYNDGMLILDKMVKMKKEFKREIIDNIAFPSGINKYEENEAASQGMYGDGLITYKKHCHIHVRAALNYNHTIEKYGLKLQPVSTGTKLKYIYTYKNNYLRQNVIAFINQWPEEFNDIFEVDYETQWYKSLESVIGRFYEVLGWGQINLNSTKMSKFLY